MPVLAARARRKLQGPLRSSCSYFLSGYVAQEGPRFSSRSARGRRMMGSGERGASIWTTTLRAWSAGSGLSTRSPRQLDWIALQCLKGLGLLEERNTGGGDLTGWSEAAYVDAFASRPGPSPIAATLARGSRDNARRRRGCAASGIPPPSPAAAAWLPRRGRNPSRPRNFVPRPQVDARPQESFRCSSISPRLPTSSTPRTPPRRRG